MKISFSILALLICFVSFGQTNISTSITGNDHTLNWNKGGQQVDSILGIPVRDTVSWGLNGKMGNLTIRPQDGILYYRFDDVWRTTQTSIDLSQYLKYSDTVALLATKSWVESQGYLTSEVDGDPTNELQTISRSGQNINLSNSGGSVVDSNNKYFGGSNINITGSYPNFTIDNTMLPPDLSGYLQKADSSIYQTKYGVDTMRGHLYPLINSKQNQLNGLGFVKANGTTITYDNSTYLTSEVDGSVTNELQNLTNSKTGNNVTVNISNGTGTTFSVADGDSSSTNELQTLSGSGNTVSLSNGGGSYTIPAAPGTNLGNSKTGNNVTITSSTGSPTTFSTADADSSTTNELQTISKSGSTVTLSNGGGSFTDDNTTYSAGVGLTLTGTQFKADTGLLATNNDLNNYIPLSQKGANDGVATLDAGGKVPLSQLPASLMIYKGVWNASTNTPTLINGVGTAGWVYKASPGGTVDFGSGPITFLDGDWAIYNGSEWEKSGNTDVVTSVNGQQGDVNLTTTDIPEGTNLYFTNARARQSISVTGAGSYNNSTGVITINNQLQNLGLGTATATTQPVSITSGTGITLPSVTTTTAGLMSAADKVKLNGIAAGAEVNVQPDWNQTITTADDYIKNKPPIPSLTGYVQFSDTTSTIATKYDNSLKQDKLTGTGIPKLTSGTLTYINGTTSQYIRGDGSLATFPTIPTVNNGTLTMNTSGVATGSSTFTANQAGNSTFTVNVPNTLSSYTNDAGFLTSIPSWNQTTTVNDTSQNAIWVIANAPDTAAGSNKSPAAVNVVNTSSTFAPFFTVSRANLQAGSFSISSQTSSTTSYATALSSYNTNAGNHGLDLSITGKATYNTNLSGLNIRVGLTMSSPVTGGNTLQLWNANTLQMSMDASGKLKVPGLGVGSTTNMVVADGDGVLGVQAIPSFAAQTLSWNNTTRELSISGGNTVTIPDDNTTYTGSTSITLSGTSFQRAALTGDVTAAANSNATTIANNAVTNAKIANGAITDAKVTDVAWGKITGAPDFVTGDFMQENVSKADANTILSSTTSQAYHYITGGGSTNYPYSLGSGIKVERRSGATSFSGFEFWRSANTASADANNNLVLFRTMVTASAGTNYNPWETLASREWVSGLGYTTNTGTVTSVGLTIGGNALNSTPASITSSGTFGLTWAGTTSQYVNGQGNLVTFPTIPAGTVTSLTIGNGLTGTSPITSTGTITLGTPSDITLSSTNSVTASSHTHNFNPGGTASQVILGNATLGTYYGNQAQTLQQTTDLGNTTNNNIEYLNASSVYSNGSQLITHIKQPTTLWRNNAATTGYVVISHPMLTGTFQATMFDMKLKVYSYITGQASSADIRLTFYLSTATAISPVNGISATISGTNTALVNALAASGAIQVGFNANGDLAVVLGTATTNWSTYVGIQTEDITTSYTGGNNDQWQTGWTTAFIGTSVSTYTGLISAPSWINTTKDFTESTYTKQRLSGDGTVRANTVTYADTRNDNQPPSFYYAGMTNEFKLNSALSLSGASSYSSLLTIANYTDASGYTGYGQIAANNAGLWYRGAASGTAWNAAGFRRLAYIDEVLTSTPNFQQVLDAGNTSTTDAQWINGIGGRWTSVGNGGVKVYETTSGTGYSTGMFLYSNDAATQKAGVGFYNGLYGYLGWGATPYSTNRTVAWNDVGLLVTPEGGTTAPTYTFQVLANASSGMLGRFDRNTSDALSAGIRLSSKNTGGSLGYTDFVVNTQSAIAGIGYGTNAATLPIGQTGTTNLGMWVNGSNDLFSGRHLTVGNTLYIPTLANASPQMLTVGASGVVSSQAIPVNGVTSVAIGNGLTGTSPITSTGTVTLGTPSNITLSSTNSVTATSHTHAFVPGGTTAQYIRGNGTLATFPAIPDNYVATDLTTSNTITGVAGQNANNVASASLVYLSGSATNIPVGANGFLHTSPYSTTGGYQTFMGQTVDDNYWFRGKTASTWGTWHQIASRDWVTGQGYVTSNLSTADMPLPPSVTRSVFVGSGGLFRVVGNSTFSLGGPGGDPSIRILSPSAPVILQGSNNDYWANIRTSLLTANHTYDYPNADGVLALQSDINTYTGSTSITLSGSSFQRAALTGDVTSPANSNATTIAANVVSNTKLADMSANTFKGRLSSAGDPQDLTVAQMQTALGITTNNEVDDNGYGYGSATEGYRGWDATGGLSTFIIDVSANYTVPMEAHTIILHGNTNYTLTLPNPTQFKNRQLRLSYQLNRTAPNTVSLTQPLYYYANDGVTLANINTLNPTIVKATTQTAMLILHSDGNRWWIINVAL